MDEFSSGTAILTAMITPAVLISAASAMILATSQRLGRVLSRTRDLGKEAEKLEHVKQVDQQQSHRGYSIYLFIEAQAKRAELLQKALSTLYLTLGAFVATSVAIGVIAVTGRGYVWIPSALGAAGITMLFYACLLLIRESRVALGAVKQEMLHLLDLGQRHAPEELRQKIRQRKRRWLLKSLRLY